MPLQTDDSVLIPQHKPKIPRPHLAQELRERHGASFGEGEDIVHKLMPWAKSRALGLKTQQHFPNWDGRKKHR